MKNIPKIIVAVSLVALAHQGFSQTKVQPKKVPKPSTVSTSKNEFKDTSTKNKAILYITKELSKVEKDSMDVMKYASVTQPCTFLTSSEKEVIWYLNVARMYPQWYLYFFLKNPTTENEKSLYATMKQMKPASNTLIPMKALFESAKCHATSSGALGYVGHDRQSSTCKSDFNGECCQYGYDKPSQIVLDLLIDEGVPSLGH